MESQSASAKLSEYILWEGDFSSSLLGWRYGQKMKWMTGENTLLENQNQIHIHPTFIAIIKVPISLVLNLLLLSCYVMSDSLWPHGLSLPDSSDPGLSQARILEWVAISFSRVSSGPGNWTPRSPHWQVGSLPLPLGNPGTKLSK